MSNKTLFFFPCLLIGGMLALSCFLASPGSQTARFDAQPPEEIEIILEGHSVLCDDKRSVQVEGTTVTILQPGEYELTGTLEDGRILVDVDPEEEVTLKLKDVSVSCSTTAPLQILSADEVRLKLPEDTASTFTDSAFYNLSKTGDNPDACIWARSDLTVKGKGSLTVNARFHDGISTNDTFKVKDGLLTVDAPHRALYGRDGVELSGGRTELHSGDTAIQSKDTVRISGGEVEIDAGRHAVKAIRSITITDDAAVTARSAGPAVACPGKIRLAETFTQEE